jgi:hypothetical protein
MNERLQWSYRSSEKRGREEIYFNLYGWRWNPRVPIKNNHIDFTVELLLASLLIRKFLK